MTEGGMGLLLVGEERPSWSFRVSASFRVGGPRRQWACEPESDTDLASSGWSPGFNLAHPAVFRYDRSIMPLSNAAI